MNSIDKKAKKVSSSKKDINWEVLIDRLVLVNRNLFYIFGIGNIITFVGAGAGLDPKYLISSVVATGISGTICYLTDTFESKNDFYNISSEDKANRCKDIWQG